MQTSSAKAECLCGNGLTGAQRKFCSKSCKNYFNGKKRYDEVRAKVDAIKLESGCVKCGYKDNPVALDFNHTNPLEKSFNINNNYNMTWEKVEQEIAKCEVLCANCHRIHTFTHGHNTLRRT